MTDETTARDRLTEWTINGGPYNAKDLRSDVAEVLRALAGAPTADVAEVRTRLDEALSSYYGPLTQTAIDDIISKTFAAAPEGVDAADERFPRVAGRCPSCRGASSLFLGAGGHVTCSRLDCPDPGVVDDQLHAVSEEEPDGMDLEAQGEMSDQLAAAQAANEVLADALRLIAGERCESFTGPWRCSDEGSGRTRGARYGADAWCDACVAQDALRRALDGDTTEEGR